MMLGLKDTKWIVLRFAPHNPIKHLEFAGDTAPLFLHITRYDLEEQE
jgi:hypothetical protein